jgi:transcriptional regulator with XRE-family HTH domain
VDFCNLIQQRLKELGREQRDLAAATEVTESYISQLLTRKKAPPATNRTDIYERMNAFLKLPKGQLSAIVDAQRQEEWKKKLADPPAPLYRQVRELVIRKCRAKKQKQMRAIFEKQAFGELERLVTQKLLDLGKRIAKDELQSERWLKSVASLRRQSYQEVRTGILDFLDTDVFNISIAHCKVFLTPLIESWDIDLTTFAMEVHLNHRLSAVQEVHFQFVELPAAAGSQAEPGFDEFLRWSDLSGDATEDEIDFLRRLRFRQRHPTALYYYRELQILRDALNFRDIALLRVRQRRGRTRAAKPGPGDSRSRTVRAAEK